MMNSISPVRAVHARISSRWGVGSRPSARSMRASSAWNRGTSSFQLSLRASRCRVGERAGGGDVAQVEVMAGVLRSAERVRVDLPSSSVAAAKSARAAAMSPRAWAAMARKASEFALLDVVLSPPRLRHGFGREPPGFGQAAQFERDLAGVLEPDRCLLGSQATSSNRRRAVGSPAPLPAARA